MGVLGVFNDEESRRGVKDEVAEGKAGSAREREREIQTEVRASRSITSENCHPKVVGRCL